MAKQEVENEIDELNSKNKVKNIAYFILLLIIVAITSGCLFAPTFNIVSIVAESGENVSSQEILDKAQISIGENIFRINDTKIKNSIEMLSYVRKAKIYRKLPNTIILKVEERIPYANIKYLESFAITDKYGYVLEITGENTKSDLPIIYGINSEDCKTGEKLSGNANLKYENSVYLLEAAEKIGFKYKFSEINYDDSTNVKLYIKEKDIDVVYGEIIIDNIEEKLGHLASILAKLGDKSGKIDMSNEDYLARTVFIQSK